MNIPIKMVGIATTIFWIFLIVFSVSAAYSVKDLQFEFGEPQMSLQGENATFSLPIYIFNRGHYNVHSFNMTSLIRDNEGRTITRGSTFIDTIAPGQQIHTAHNITINIADFLGQNSAYLFNDTEIWLDETVGMRLAELIPVQATGNVSMPWGAPLYGFRLDAPQYEPYNATHTRVRVPIGFDNHASFDFGGIVRIRMFSSGNSMLTEGQTVFNVTQHSLYQGFMELYIPHVNVSLSGHFEAYFETPFTDYGPMVIPYG